MTAHFMDLLDELRRRSLRMASLVEDVLDEAIDAVFHSDDSLAIRVVARDNEVDSEEVAVEAEVIRLLALYQPVGIDLRLLCTVLKTNNDLERVADCAVNIAERARHLNADSLPEQCELIRQMGPIVKRMLRAAIQAYGAHDPGGAARVFSEEEVVDALYGQLVRSVVNEGSQNPDAMASLLDVLSIAKNLERIADHATNISEDVIYMCTGEIVRHRPH